MLLALLLSKDICLIHGLKQNHYTFGGKNKQIIVTVTSTSFLKIKLAI